jgi:hypothetical protein
MNVFAYTREPLTQPFSCGILSYYEIDRSIEAAAHPSSERCAQTHA